MASTNPDLATSDPISITFTDPKCGTIVWIPAPSGQKRLSKVPVADMPKVTKALRRSLKTRLKGVNGDLHDATDHKKRAEALVALESPDVHTSGGLSVGDAATRPFRRNAGV